MTTRTSTAGCTRAGNHHDNEDGWGSTGALAWVLDGATGTGAAALVQRVTAALRAHAYDDASLTDIVTAALNEAVQSDGASATLAVTRRVGDSLEWLILGDATVVYRDEAGKLQRLTDDRLASVGVFERAAWCNAVSSGASAGTIGQAWTRLRAVEDAARNTVGGFWVAGAGVDVTLALAGTATTSHPVLLLTDGALDGVGAAWPTLGTLYERAAAVDPADLLRDLDAGLDDTDVRWIDDATLVKQQLISERS